MVRRYPKHAQWLSPRLWREQVDVGTMAVTVSGNRAAFFYSHLFVDGCTADELLGVVHHEINHLVFGHPFLDPERFPHRQALVIAEEVTVNEYVDEPLPGNPLLLEQFPELPPGEDTVTRYHRLKDRDDLGGRAAPLDLHGWHLTSGDDRVMSELADLQHSLIARLRRHASRETVRDAIIRFGATGGNEILRVMRESSAAGRPVDWRHLLDRLLGQHACQEATLLRPPRRMPEMVGVIPGKRFQPDRPKVVAAIDTSSSMEQRHFERIRHELRHLREHADIVVVECDKKIRRSYPLREDLQAIHGRGGTDFRPVLGGDWLKKQAADLLIYFTDGDGPVPAQQPKTRIVWGLLGPGTSPAPWGEVLRLDI